jgi:PAS domain S-box-containing protein
MKKIINYLPFFVLFFLPLLFYPGADTSGWRSSSDVHALLEFASSPLAITAGIMVLLHFFTTGRWFFLIISIGFVLIGAEEFVHAIFSFNRIWSEKPPTFELAISTTWLAGNFILATSFFIARLFGKKEIVPAKRVLNAVVYNIIGLIFAAAVALLIFNIPFLPYFVQLGSITKKLIELSLALLYFVAFLFYSNIYLKQQSRSPLLWSIIACIIFRVLAHIFVFDAQAFYDSHWDTAHLIVFLSYFFPIFGVWGETIKLHRSAHAQLIELEKEMTERKRAEEALRESEEKYRLIAENTADLISILDMNLRFTYVSPASMRLRGFTVEEAMEQALEQVLTPESMRLGLTVFEEEMQLEASGTADPDRMRILELEEYKKDGSIIWVEVSLSFLRDKDGKPVEILMVSRDITERKRAESEIQALARFPSENPNPVLRIARDGMLLYVNEASLSQLPDWHLQAGRGVPSMVRDVASEVLNSGKARLLDLEHRGRVYSFFVAPIADAGYANLYGRDITDHKRAEEDRERLLAEIAAKNQELESFVYTISHDLRAPLVSMDGFCSLLKRESQDQLGEQGQHYLERIRANVAHMNTLVTELLELSRIGRVVGPEEEIDVGVLLREIEEGLVLKLEQEGVEFIVQQPLPAVRGDRGRIRQVFANLIENAVKFRSLERGLRIEVGCEEERGFYRFHVGDNGIGILPQYQEQIFEPFRQLDRGIEGVGMGLALVKRIVAYHRGRFWVESELGKGSTFYFTIPDRTNDDVRSAKYDRRLTRNRREPMKGESK